MKSDGPEEIYLKDYSKLLIKNKSLIGIVFLIALIGSSIFSFYSPKIYTVETWIEVGKAKNVPVEQSAQIVRKIREGLYGKYKNKIEAIVANQTNLINVKIKSENLEKAKEFLNALNSRILSEHNVLINQERLFIEDRIKKAEKEIKLWSENKKRFYAGSGDPVYQLSFLWIELAIEGRQNDIEVLKSSLSGVIDTKIIKEPEVLPDSQIRKFLLNSIVFGIVGLFLGIFLSFWKEW